MISVAKLEQELNGAVRISLKANRCVRANAYLYIKGKKIKKQGVEQSNLAAFRVKLVIQSIMRGLSKQVQSTVIVSKNSV